MFRSKTLFILGAGASSEVGLPLGSDLTSQIAKDLAFEFRHGFEQVNGDQNIAQTLVFLARQANPARVDPNPLFRACHRIRDGMVVSRSIDNFLDNHQDDEQIVLCGKIAIANSILAAERGSLLYVDRMSSSRSLDLSKIADTWFVKFFQLLHEGVPKSKIAALFDNTAFIVFNYDRCLEQFLINAVQAAYGTSETDAESVVRHARIYHPYGTIGPLPWQEQQGIGFGGGPLGQNGLIRSAARIRTYTERLEESDLLAALRTEIRKANTVVFLGFAYHDQNMTLLNPSGPTEIRRILGTTCGISANDVSVVEHRIRRSLCESPVYSDPVALFTHNRSCDFFDEFKLRLTG